MIIIPMAGLSRRFTEAGYKVPKYMLPAHGRSVFAHAVESFSAYFKTQRFLFVVRDVADTRAFVTRECAALGITRAEVVVLDRETRGQAETVMLGLEQVTMEPDEPVTIFNIDTFRPGFRFPEFGGAATDGYLEVFRGSGPNWSNVRAAAPDSDLVVETAEKQEISDLCCTGLYHFRTIGLYRQAYQAQANDFQPSAKLKELFVAPMYNELIRLGHPIRFDLIPADAVIFCGVPAEYDAFLARKPD